MKKWKYTVVSVNPHPEENGWGIVSVRPIFDTEEEAMCEAKRWATELMKSVREFRLVLDQIKFEDVWKKVDNGQLGAARDVGYDPLPDTPAPVRWHRMRVVSTFMKGDRG